MDSCQPMPDQVSIPDNYRVLDQFLQKEQWLEHVKGLQVPTAIQLVSYSVKDTMFHGLH
jgi:hypothetical protein